jgi:hypothetical protein
MAQGEQARANLVIVEERVESIQNTGVVALQGAAEIASVDPEPTQGPPRHLHPDPEPDDEPVTPSQTDEDEDAEPALGLAEGTDIDPEDDEEAAILTVFEQAQASISQGTAVRVPAKRQRRKRTTTREANIDQKERAQAKREREKDGRHMNFYTGHEGGAFAARMNVRKFKALPDPTRLLLAVTLVRSETFADIFDTKEKITGYLHQVVNKGKDMKDKTYVSKKGLKRLIAETVTSGMLSTDETGPVITDVGLLYLQKQKREKRWW